MISIGTAGWNIPRAAAQRFGADGSHLERYARVLSCVEIDSSFYRPHRVSTYERWSARTPPGFRFAVKLPRTVTHDARLVDIDAPLDRFLAEVAGLGSKLGVLLAQLPPSLAFDASIVGAFLDKLRDRHAGALVCEPRHASWFTPGADALLVDRRVGRVAADPALPSGAGQPGGWLGVDGDGADALVYHRWHGSPRMYRSAYDDAWLLLRAGEIARLPPTADVWCVFDNTAAGAAVDDASRLRAIVASSA